MEMENDFADIVNYFLSNGMNITEKYIHAEDIGVFFATLTDVYAAILENGVVSVAGDGIQFNNKHTKDFFNAGLIGLKQAKEPGALKLLLNFLFIQKTRDNAVSTANLFEIYLLANIMPILLPEERCVKKFIDYLIEFCGGKTQHRQIAKFVKFIDSYNIKGCRELEIIRALDTKAGRE